MTRALAITALLLGLGCALAPPAPPARESRVPGAKRAAEAAQVEREYGCGKRKRPYFVLEESSLAPSPLAAGEEFDHRVAYALCPARPGAAVAGKLRTRILFEGKAVVDDTTDYRLDPGRFVVDTFIALPPSAPPGAYELDVSFASPKVRFATKLPFSVVAH